MTTESEGLRWARYVNIGVWFWLLVSSGQTAVFLLTYRRKRRKRGREQGRLLNPVVGSVWMSLVPL